VRDRSDIHITHGKSRSAQKRHEQGTRSEDRQQPRLLQTGRQKLWLRHETQSHLPRRHQSTEGSRRTQGRQKEQQLAPDMPPFVTTDPGVDDQQRIRIDNDEREVRKDRRGVRRGTPSGRARRRNRPSRLASTFSLPRLPGGSTAHGGAVEAPAPWCCVRFGRSRSVRFVASGPDIRLDVGTARSRPCMPRRAFPAA
jgi:hypothetical protein